MSEISPSNKSISELVWMEMIRTLRYLMHHSDDERNRLAAIRTLVSMERVAIARDRETRLQTAAASGKAPRPKRCATGSASAAPCTKQPHGTGKASGTGNAKPPATVTTNCEPSTNGADTTAGSSYPALDRRLQETAVEAAASEHVVEPTASNEPPSPVATEPNFAAPTSQPAAPTAVVAASPAPEPNTPAQPEAAQQPLPPVTVEMLVNGEPKRYPFVADLDMDLVEDAAHYHRLTQLAADEWQQEQAAKSAATKFQPLNWQPNKPQHDSVAKEDSTDDPESKSRPPPC